MFAFVDFGEVALTQKVRKVEDIVLDLFVTVVAGSAAGEGTRTGLLICYH